MDDLPVETGRRWEHRESEISLAQGDAGNNGTFRSIIAENDSGYHEVS